MATSTTATNSKISSRIKSAPSAMVKTIAAAALLATPLASSAAYTPFGYQSDSTHSEEYKRLNDATATSSSSSSSAEPKSDPSSFAGAVHYDPLHNSLYMTGATFASGSVFDGVDVFELTTTEQEELGDENDKNDGYWWDEMATGLNPHLMDVGVPGFPATKGDCFYSVLALPEISAGDPEGVGSANTAGSGSGGDANRVKMVHTRRFGSEQTLDACSAIDILHATSVGTAASPGGWAHDFDHNNYLGAFPDGDGDEIDLGSGTHMPTYPNVANPDESFETFAPQPTNAPAIPPSMAGSAVDGPTFPGESFVGAPAIDGGLGNGPTTPAGTTAGPPSRRLRAHNTGEGLSTNAEQEKKDLQQQRKQQQKQQQKHQRSMQESSPGPFGIRDNAGIPSLKTRSVRLLMAGHTESTSNKREGYIVENLPEGHFDEAQVYAFAQQVDIRLPMGDLEKAAENLADAQNLEEENWEEFHYDLHTEGKEEDELAQELGEDWKDDMHVHKEDFAKIVTSGVESRALLNDHVPPDVQTLYPVSIVADATSKKHYYVASLASENSERNVDNPMAMGETQHKDPTIGAGAGQRAWTDYNNQYIDEAGKFGTEGKPGYGNNYRVVVKKMTIEAIADTIELSDVELALSEKSYSNETIAMRHDWMREMTPEHGEDVRPAGMLFAPSGNANGEGDVLIIAGTTAGRGSAFGTTSNTNKDGDADLDGFVTKLRTDSGAEAGLIDLDPVSLLFHNTFSMRILSNPGQREVVSGICAKPLKYSGTQDKMTHVYVVGSSSAVLPAVPAGVRSGEFLAKYPEKVGTASADAMEAFLMKIDLSTMKTVWTVQVGAIIHGNDADDGKGKAFGYGCAVTRDGEDVYLTGLVKENGVVTDFSEQDMNDFADNQHGNRANGGIDVFLGSYKTNDGSRNFLKQFGSDRDDYPSRGDGGVTTDRFGNAIVTGNTRGSIMRERDNNEFRYGKDGKDGAMDVFIMSFARAGLHHVDVVGADVVSRPAPAPAPVVPAPPPPTNIVIHEPVEDSPVPINPVNASPEDEAKDGALAGVVALSLAFILMAAGTSAFVIYRIRVAKLKEQQALVDNTNLHTSRSGGRTLPGRRKSAWGANGLMPRSNSQMKDNFEDLNIMVEVRNSASGGWHGVYDDEQLQAIDFGEPSHNGGGSDGSGGDKNVVEESLFMEDGLKEIEDGLENYEIGDMNMDDVSDEELIRAYNEAMALDIEPENPDVEFAMAGIGSEPILDEEHHQIT